MPARADATIESVTAFKDDLVTEERDRGPDQDPHPEFRDRRYSLHRVSGAGLHGGPGRERRVRYQAAAVQLHVAGDAQFGVRLQHGDARAGS